MQEQVLVDPIPEVRSVAARAIGSLIRGMGEENFPDLVPWLFDTLKSENSNVERSGAAQGLSEVRRIYFLAIFQLLLMLTDPLSAVVIVTILPFKDVISRSYQSFL